MKKTKAKKVSIAVRHTGVLIILITLALVIYAVLNLGPISEETSVLINTYGVPALLVVSIFLDLIPQIISPIVALGAGIVAGINVYLAIIATVLGSTIGSLLGFFLGKKYMFDAVDVLTTKKTTDRLTYLTNKYGRIIVPIAAISPLPYVPVALGAINFTKRNFIIFGLIPRAIGLIGYGLLFDLI